MTQGGPGSSTDILPMFIYQHAFQFNQAGSAAAASVVMLVMSIILIGVEFRLLGKVD